jgi:hypothetical protein
MVSAAMRRRRDVRLRDLIRTTFLERGQARILDLGGSASYWNRVGWDFLQAHGVSLTLLNHVASEFDVSAAGRAPDDLRMVVGDACDLADYPDQAFDIVHSNSVIEHVGDWTRMQAFARETRRVGVRHYVQTPYFWFPIEPHFYRAPLIHWLPRPLQTDILSAYSAGQVGRLDRDAAIRKLDFTRLLDKRQVRSLFPDARLLEERVGFLTKSLIAIG